MRQATAHRVAFSLLCCVLCLAAAWTRAARAQEPDGVRPASQDVEAELASALIAAKTGDERKALLAARAQSVNPKLVRELNKQARPKVTPKTMGELLPVFELAREIAERLNDRPGLIESWRNVGNIHRVRGDAPRAIEAFNKSLSLAEEEKDLEAAAAALNAIAATYFMKGDHDQVLVYLHR